MDNMKEIKIDLVIRTDKELYVNKIYQEIFDGFINDHKKYGDFKGELKNRTWYISGNKVYEAYTINNVNFLKEIELGSCIDDNGLNQVIITDDKILILERNWKKCPENMKLFKNSDIRVI